MATQRLAYWLQQLGWPGESSRGSSAAEVDPADMGTAFGLDASLAPESGWSDSATAALDGCAPSPTQY